MLFKASTTSYSLNFLPSSSFKGFVIQERDVRIETDRKSCSVWPFVFAFGFGSSTSTN
ncbi:hypothetical protein ES288_D02G105200v1 [Gossypium darwinii]|uniref:Uncharacterized protein n=1 Tax=Gossypium darwinii TaxID=34276 RepID=A0A5D2DFE6_GOSDA|nr:hypothetical protein ES288_D02G105200v1 [Gossypium darwinii]